MHDNHPIAFLNLPKHLFWDVNPSTLDVEAHRRYIIHRVITRGNEKNWVVIRDYYGMDRLKEEILMMRDLDPKTHTFFSTIFDIPKSEFRCSTYRQSIY